MTEDRGRTSRGRLAAVWESRVGRVLGALGLDDVRTAIVTLAVLAAVIPVLVTGFISYRQNQRAIDAKLVEQLSGLSAQTAREVDLWLKESQYNLRVFATSYEVTDNIGAGRGAGRLTDYLSSVADRFPDYDELLVVAPDGRPVASSDGTPGQLRLTGDWMAQARSGDPVVGEPFRRDSGSAAMMELAVPIVGTSGRFLGVFAARLKFDGVQELLRGFLAGRDGRLAVTDREGRVITATGGSADSLRPGARERLERAEGRPMRYDAVGGTPVVGALTTLPRTGWGALAEIPQAAAFAEIRRLRNTTAVLTLALLLVVGAFAWALALVIVRPLDRLTRAARRVAGGELDVEVPAAGGGELAQLTTTFNDMVRRLRGAREELEQLSLTDPLTGLANRRGMMAELERDLLRSDRLKRECVVLMLDVDHFKKFNDTWGHPAGDAVLVRIAGIVREHVREVDVPARYGGEEFLVILPETSPQQGRQVAERIRESVATEKLAANGGAPVSVTVSIGLAGFPGNGTTPATLIAAADQALYRSKEAGRNRVTIAESS